MTFCADAICPKIDRTGMAASLEVCPPLLDHWIVEFGISAPVCPEFDREPKAALREILRRRQLSHLLQEPRRGFSLKDVNEMELLGVGREPRSESILAAGWRKRLKRDKRPSRDRVRAISYLDTWLDRVVSVAAE